MDPGTMFPPASPSCADESRAPFSWRNVLSKRPAAAPRLASDPDALRLSRAVYPACMVGGALLCVAIVAAHLHKDGAPSSRVAALEVALAFFVGLTTAAITMRWLQRDRIAQRIEEHRLSRLAKNLDSALTHMSQGLCLFDADERLLLSNKRLQEMYGLSDSVMAAVATFADLVQAIVRHREPAERADAIAADWYAKHRRLIVQPGGGEIIVKPSCAKTLSVVHRPAPDGSWVSTFEDISDRLKSEVLINHMALHDRVTDLPNRRHFMDRLGREMARAKRETSLVGVLLFNLDRFKDVCDRSGRSIADDVLHCLANNLREAADDDEVVACFGGDDFGVIKLFGDESDLLGALGRIQQAIRTPVAIGDTELRLAASIGIAIFPDDAATADQIVGHASLALRRAQETHNGAVCRYERGMDEAIRARRMLAADLAMALERREFIVYYQVQRSVTTGRIVGYEALIRWPHATRGMVSPAEFIPIAEETGCIAGIGEWVLRQACAEASVWPHGLRVAVNLSAAQFEQNDLADVVGRALADYALAPERLELEITETAIIRDRARALRTLQQIKALGVKIAMDDFGTGYASLDTLTVFPFDKIKIDRSFLINSDDASPSRSVIRMILALGQSLNMPVLAEGVETADQLAFLRAAGCEEAQGYLLGFPMPDGQLDHCGAA